MANYKPKDLAVFLRRCCNGICDDSCPCAEVHSECDVELMQMAAAAMLDEQDAKISELEQLIAKLRRIIASHKI